VEREEARQHQNRECKRRIQRAVSEPLEHELLDHVHLRGFVHELDADHVSAGTVLAVHAVHTITERDMIGNVLIASAR